MLPLPQIRPATSRRAKKDWFEDGVRFRCLGPECGACCSGRQGPGAVWVERDDVRRLAEHLSLSPRELTHRYLRRIQGRWSLRERADFDCVFYRPGEGCTVYAARPTQCRTYPFWGRILASPATWENEAEACPGIGCDETRVAADEMRRALGRRHPAQSAVVRSSKK